MRISPLSVTLKSAIVGCLLFAGSACAQEKAPSRREAIQKEYGATVEIKFDQPYAGNTNPKQMVDLYLPKKRASEKPLPVVVYIHGGGWSGGDRMGYGSAAARQASSGNYAGVAVGYRLSGEAKWPAQIHDCKAAIRWVRGHAKEYNLDPDRIAVEGGSAGGHLVSLLGLTAGNKELEGNLGEFTKLSSKVTCVVNRCGPTDMTKPLMQGDAALKDDPAVTGLLGGSIKDKLEAAKQASPLTYVTKDAAPFLTAHGSKDLRVNFTNATNIDAALKKAGASSLLIEVTDGGHSIGGGPELEKRVQQFIDMHLRDIKSEIPTTPIPTVAPAKPVTK
ncbi:MAG: alpha/beta hydrolase [Planctomycetes bacterium]|nr:alpha/beta hydrolase [Planctomycetota bacterium]